MCSRESSEYSVCSSILPCLSSWLSSPCSPLSSRVRIFREAHKKKSRCFPLPGRAAGPGGEQAHFCWVIPAPDPTQACRAGSCFSQQPVIHTELFNQELSETVREEMGLLMLTSDAGGRQRGGTAARTALVLGAPPVLAYLQLIEVICAVFPRQTLYNARYR